MPRRLNNRTIGKFREAWPESKAIAELAAEVARLERAIRETEDISNAACREAEARAGAAEAKLAESPPPATPEQVGGEARALELLRWAVNWIEYCAEVPVPDEGEGHELELFTEAKRLVAPHTPVAEERCPTCGSDDPAICLLGYVYPWGLEPGGRPHGHGGIDAEGDTECCSNPFHTKGQVNLETELTCARDSINSLTGINEALAGALREIESEATGLTRNDPNAMWLRLDKIGGIARRTLANCGQTRGTQGRDEGRDRG